MKIAFLIEKNTFYRVFGSLIDEALLRGHEVYCFHDHNAINNGFKGYLYPSINDVPDFLNGKPIIVFYKDFIDFADIITKNNIDIVVSNNFYDWHIKLKNIIKPTKWVAIQYALDMLIAPHLIDIPDRYFFFSEIWFKLTNTFTKNKQVGNNVRYMGCSEVDQKKIIDPSQIRKELGIPENKTVVLYLSFQYLMQENQLYSRYIFTDDNPIMKIIACLRHPKYINHVLQGYNNKKMFEAIKTFCKKNDAYLIINGRQKSPIPSYIKGDKTITEVSFYPADILKYLSISTVCFNFWSTVVTECVPMDVYNVCISPKDIFSKNHRSSSNYDIFNHVLNICPDLFDYEGVTIKMNIPEIISSLPNMNIKEFTLDPIRKVNWINKFLTHKAYNSSELIIKEIENIT